MSTPYSACCCWGDGFPCPDLRSKIPAHPCRRVPHVHHLNLQKAVGGGEVYTRWFTRALVEAGATVTLYVDPDNAFWNGLASEWIEIVPARNVSDVVRRLPGQGAWIITQSRVPNDLVELASTKHVLTGFSHMPMLNRSAAEFTRYSAVYTVSEYCIDLLRRAGISQVYPVPMYGTWELERPASRTGEGRILAKSAYHWDRRKGRDYVFSKLEPVVWAFRKQPAFERKPGLTLGVMSLLSPIKQFPALFALLAPRIANFPEVSLEIFGDGGYAQVRDLRKALAPIANRVRFWGYQEDVQAVYSQFDYLMTGLPEKEALGLNVLEAQALGTPVLAPRASPFLETMVDGKTGYLYRDPRGDDGTDFNLLLGSLVAGRTRPDPRSVPEHLATFSFSAMVERTRSLLAYMSQRFSRIYAR
jgi:glycosyltransferase involved in cell wall biosynthesis